MYCALNRIPVLNKKASKTQIENALEIYIYINCNPDLKSRMWLVSGKHLDSTTPKTWE